MQIKDSGNRREFNTGAVRDMVECKGRICVKGLLRHFSGMQLPTDNAIFESYNVIFESF
jgi:hypothetical protein